MTRLLLGDPGAAAHSAKNVHAAPGLPSQPRQDRKGRTPMVGEETARIRKERARARALTALNGARDALVSWVDLIRQDAEARVGSGESVRVVADPAYDRALVIFHEFGEVSGRFDAHAARIEAGEIR